MSQDGDDDSDAVVISRRDADIGFRQTGSISHRRGDFLRRTEGEAGDGRAGAAHHCGRAAGGDDAIAIKAISGSASNIRIIGNSFENLAYFCSIGSEIGMLEADDPSRSRGVYNVVVAGNCGIACSGLLFVKPGAISNYDFRDGTVEGVVVSDNVLRDITGAKFTRRKEEMQGARRRR